MKYAMPLTLVPGASPRRHLTTFKHLVDKLGRWLWDMPKPIGVHITKQVFHLLDKSDPKKPRIKRVWKDKKFPVYRGITAKNARYMRSQYRRERRKLAEKGMAKRAIDSSLSLIKSILNPTGGIHGT